MSSSMMLFPNIELDYMSGVKIFSILLLSMFLRLFVRMVHYIEISEKCIVIKKLFAIKLLVKSDECAIFFIFNFHTFSIIFVLELYKPARFLLLLYFKHRDCKYTSYLITRNLADEE